MSHKYQPMTELERELEDAGDGHADGVRRVSWQAVAPSHTASHDEEMQPLVRRVFAPNDEGAPRTVVVCGVSAQNTSSSICARIGRVIAANNLGRVCLVDANLCSPRLSDMFDIALLPKVAASTTSVMEQCGQVESNLWVAGPGLLGRYRTTLPPPEEIRKLLIKLRAAFDYLLIDVPGTSVCGDAQVLGSIADAAILVIEANRTRRLSARNAQQTLTAAGVRILGTVLNNRSFPIPEGIYKRL